MTLLELPHGKTQINEYRKFNGKVDETWAERKTVMTGEVSAAEAIQHKPPGHEMWSRAQRKKWRDKEAKKQRKKDPRGGGGEKGTPGRGHLISLSGAATFPPPCQPAQTPPPNATARGGAELIRKRAFCAFSPGDREDRQVQTYYLPDPRPSSPVLFQRVCLAWD